MVRGLDIFRDHFQNYADRYVLIGGATRLRIAGELSRRWLQTRLWGRWRNIPI